MLRYSTRIASLFAAALLIGTVPALAGPPLLCHTFDIGDARSLPWDGRNAWFQGRPDYDIRNVVADTEAILTPSTPVLVRMETLRRAALYAKAFEKKGHPRLGDELLARLQARALDAEAAGAPDPLAWFDAGYFAASLREGASRQQHGPAGYGWVLKALQARGNDPEMELGAALIMSETPDRPGRHWPRAAAGSKTNPLLARNLAARASR